MKAKSGDHPNFDKIDEKSNPNPTCSRHIDPPHDVVGDGLVLGDYDKEFHLEDFRRFNAIIFPFLDVPCSFLNALHLGKISCKLAYLENELIAVVAYTYNEKENCVDINEIACSLQQRRKHHGQRLLEEAKKFAKEKGAFKIRAEVDTNNKVGQAFFKAMGFRKREYIKDFYKCSNNVLQDDNRFELDIPGHERSEVSSKTLSSCRLY